MSFWVILDISIVDGLFQSNPDRPVPIWSDRGIP